MESLFSLEVIVNFLKLSPSRPNSSPCLLPTVSFRLLDYPIIAISLMEKFDADHLKSRLCLDKSFELIDTLPCFTQLLDKDGRFLFNKGKSCLFRADIEDLRGHLSNTPMYIMVLDTFFEPYKLLGTLAVPLYDLIDEIYEETVGDSQGPPDIPCIKMSHGVCDVRNLMGNVIGHVSFVCRLTSFGKSISPHLVNVKQPVEVKKIESSKNKDHSEPHIQIASKEEQLVNTNSSKNNAMVQTVPIDYQETRIEISDGVRRDKKEDKATQSPQPNRKLSAKKTQRLLNEENFFDEFRPPPLFFNSELEKRQIQVDSGQIVNEIKSKQSFLSVRMEYLSWAYQNQEHLDEEEDTHEEENNSMRHIEVSQHREVVVKPGVNLDQMPILRSLFEEISQLKSMIQGEKRVEEVKKTPTVKTSRPSKPSNKKPLVRKEKKYLKKQEVTREQILESVNRLSQPKVPNLKPTIKSTNKSEIINTSRTSVDKPIPKPRKLQSPKEPLKYGTTYTHRLRVLASHGRLEAEKPLEEEPKNPNEITRDNEMSLSHDQHLMEMLDQHLERVLHFESTGSAASTGVNNIDTANNKLGTNQSTGNLSLLNKVELESTMDTMNYQNLVNMNQTPTKTVQFGNTYVYDRGYSPDEHGSSSSETSTNPSSRSHQKRTDEDSSESSGKNESGKNIFLKKREHIDGEPTTTTDSNYSQHDKYDEDFHSSFESSSSNQPRMAPRTHTDDFFSQFNQDYDDFDDNYD